MTARKKMRGGQNVQGTMFSYISLEERVPAAHPLRKLRGVVDALLATMDREFEAVYARRGRPSVPPEMLLKALLLQILFSIRSERQLVEAIEYNLLYRWFVGLNIDDKVWDHSTFSANRERLFNEDLARAFFDCVKLSAQWGKLASDEHFSVDGTLIEAWASHKSFKRRGDDSSPPPGRNPEVDFKGQERSNDTHESTTDADARLFKKSPGDKSRLCHMGHILMENRNGLIVDVEITHASGTAEREAALAMLGRRPNRHRRVTVGGLAKTQLIGQASSRAKRCCALPPTTSFVWAASEAGGTRIMRECGDRCARKGRDDLKTGLGDGRNAALTPLSCQKRGHRGMQRV
jgi:transposase